MFSGRMTKTMITDSMVAVPVTFNLLKLTVMLDLLMNHAAPRIELTNRNCSHDFM